MKTKTTAILLAWLFWPAYDFYLGKTGKGIWKILTVGGIGVWALVDAILITIMPEEEFNQRYNG